MGMRKTDVIHPLLRKKIHSEKDADMESKRLEHNHNKRKTKETYMTY